MRLTKQQLAQRKAQRRATELKDKETKIVSPSVSGYGLTSIHGSEKADWYRATTAKIRAKSKPIRRAKVMEFTPICILDGKIERVKD